MKTLSKEDLKYLNAGLTVGMLREFLSKHPELPDDGLVMIERVEDVYYEKHGWKVYKKGDDEYHPAWCSKLYPEDNNLFIDLHY